MYLNVATDDFYQKIAQKLNRNSFFSLRSIRINTVPVLLYVIVLYQVLCLH